MIDAILTSLSSLPKELSVTIIAALPVLELRGAIPIGLSMGLDIKRVVFFSIIGNLILSCMPVKRADKYSGSGGSF